MTDDDTGHPGQFFSRPGSERVLGSIEQNVGHIDDESTGRIARLQDQIELIEQLLPKLSLALLRFQPESVGFAGCLARFLYFKSELLLLSERCLLGGVGLLLLQLRLLRSR